MRSYDDFILTISNEGLIDEYRNILIEYAYADDGTLEELVLENKIEICKKELLARINNK